MKKVSTKKIVLGGVLTALVIALYLMASFIRLGTFSTATLVLVPIILGGATCGCLMGAWLGLVFGLVVLLSGDAGPFLAISVPGTIITVLAKGALSGLLSALVYKALNKWNKLVAVISASLICPFVNTAIFVLGCLTFFLPALSLQAGDQNVFLFILTVYVGGNFFLELGVNAVLAPVIFRLLNIKEIKG
ncbi:MAG: ECF transporter S component [Clostridia bacterium]|nr:ECF transporter S component [Clostridia bacterium]